ncbi:MAG: hypothetical protein JWQ90_122 [Hydrocarboniphaga sp.]|uniref:DUF934 domain-containing protein n=1 Tax=Hydrocarboniphaga sp. TaxID=2033016 RepID=UPI00260CBAEB|nr:DUF934 domain-containing protein [Hydrocarboniphaga sp.]MDB5967672.1 hypothetical protein [Hydrocarboniphaga sp.]
MSLLIRDGAVLSDDWLLLADGEAPPKTGKLIVSWDRWNAERTDLDLGALEVGLLLPNTLDVTAALGDLLGRPLLALSFPSFSDGRAYSQATLLRRRHHYAGELRATGQAVVRDQLQQMRTCGFDTFLLRNDQNPELCAKSFHDLTVAYQPNLLNISGLRPGKH